MSKSQKNLSRLRVYGIIGSIFIIILLSIGGFWHHQNKAEDTILWSNQRTTSGITYTLPQGSEQPSTHSNGSSTETWVDLPDDFRLVIQEDLSDYDIKYFTTIDTKLSGSSETVYDSGQPRLYLRRPSKDGDSIIINTADHNKAIVYIWRDISSTFKKPSDNTVGMANPVGDIDENDSHMQMLKKILESFQFPNSTS